MGKTDTFNAFNRWRTGLLRRVKTSMNEELTEHYYWLLNSVAMLFQTTSFLIDVHTKIGCLPMGKMISTLETG